MHLRHGSTKKEKVQQGVAKINKQQGPGKFTKKQKKGTSKGIYEANAMMGREEEENTRAINDKYLK